MKTLSCGAVIYRKFARPAAVDLEKLAAHYAISSLFQQYEHKTRVFSFSFENEDRQLLTAGKTRLAVGRTRILSEITQETEVLSYGVLYLGEHNLTGAVRRFDSKEAYDAMFREVKTAFESADYPETIRLLDRHFGSTPCSLKSLFKDEQRRILDEILTSTHEDLESRFRLITERYTPLMNFLKNVGAPLPNALETARDYVLRGDIRRLVNGDPIDLDQLRTLMQEAQLRNGGVLDANLSYAVKNRMEQMMQQLVEQPMKVERIEALDKLAQLVMPLPLGLNLWKVQNTYWELLQKLTKETRPGAPGNDEGAKASMARFLELGRTLGFAMKSLETPSELKIAA